MRATGPISSEIEFDVSFHDVDMVGVVWHGSYLRYMENARWELMRRLDYGLERMLASGAGWPIIDLQVKYINAARFGDRLRARASLIEWENRLAVNYLITRTSDGTRVLRGRTVQVAVKMSSGELQFASPRDFVERVQAALARKS